MMMNIMLRVCIYYVSVYVSLCRAVQPLPTHQATHAGVDRHDFGCRSRDVYKWGARAADGSVENRSIFREQAVIMRPV